MRRVGEKVWLMAEKDAINIFKAKVLEVAERECEQVCIGREGATATTRKGDDENQTCELPWRG